MYIPVCVCWIFWLRLQRCLLDLRKVAVATAEDGEEVTHEDLRKIRRDASSDQDVMTTRPGKPLQNNRKTHRKIGKPLENG